MLSLTVAPLAAQDSGGPPPPRLRLQGEMGSDGELYHISGREARRPGESGRLFLNPVLTFGSLSITGNFLLSSESSSLIGLGGLPGRQRINQFGLNPRWGWGAASVGSFSGAWTPLTWGGVRVDGVGLDLTPGILRFGAFRGTSRQPVFGGATSGSFARSMFGARLGAGRRPEAGMGGRFIDVVFLSVRDDPASLPALPDTTPVPYLPDSLAVAPDTALLPHVPINPYAVTPQENAVIATALGASLFDGALSWTGEVAGSLHSRDRRASPLTDEQAGDFPRLLRGLVTPRLGTHADLAYRSQLDLRVARLPGATNSSPRSLTLSLGLQSIGAGYVSLGTPYLPNDLRGIEGRVAVRFRRWSLQVDGLDQRDNLLSQKLATTNRSRLGISLITQPFRSWNASFRAMTVGMDRDLADSLGAVDYAARMLSTTQTWIPGNRGPVRSLSASYTWQHTGDDNPLRAASTLNSHTADVRVAVKLGATGSVTPSLGVTQSRVGTDDGVTRATYGLAGDWRDAQRRWSTALSLSRAQAGRTNAFTSRLTARFAVTTVDAVTLTVRTSSYRSLIDHGQDFDEQVFSLRWGRRF